jgi:hypothetical protein
MNNKRHGVGQITRNGVTTEGTWSNDFEHGVWIVQIAGQSYQQAWNKGVVSSMTPL